MRAIFLIPILLSGCASAPPIESLMIDLRPAAISTADEHNAKQAVTASLKDPTSAKFGPVVGAVDASGVKYACGTVNAKNSFGGYTGNEMFAVRWIGPERIEVVSIGNDFIGAHSCGRMASRHA
ncbi:hypothetical protein APY04_0154 [Hyphomicrobium sulfonivorans]|uniref:Uncharacterized protein n=1 Tax=Hyphomicrobium sulfonivorans TaxID=121290 RepID=A0A125NWB2_HYPSL|nr:hypothetical protein [Hyphomicrobium sulfonivorans]KWT72360.1 hypothetical protein APY04_0154 [Hyphomicrobium sulfonivorans]